MTLREYRKTFISTLESIYGQDEAESFFYMILEDKHQLRRIDLALNDQVLTDAHFTEWNSVQNLLLQQIPIQYILGSAFFCGLKFKVTPAVLIPRPETEELVEWIANYAGSKEISVLDIGTGSGCIAISLAYKLPKASVSAIDISAKALDIAIENANSNNVKVDFHQADILVTNHLGKKIDIIVSNPPYVRELEKGEIKVNVLSNEPHLALFVPDNDALLFYKKIADLAIDALSPDGLLFFEINQYLGAETLEMLQHKGFIAELKKDIYGNDRMICARIIRNATLQ